MQDIVSSVYFLAKKYKVKKSFAVDGLSFTYLTSGSTV